MKQLILLVSALFILSEAPAQVKTAADDSVKKEGVERLVQNEERQIQVYPNPSSGIVNVSLKGFGSQKAELRIMNVIGNVVYKEALSEYDDLFTKTFDLTGYAKGLYYIKIEAENFTDIKKVIVK
ncbi:MAG: T9SS type A sorting domain-containing protein [Hymenobacteraceae bacterium]|nr:T9SS type A sorting domain-containing protein [Hymenobacteraceae bacterium]MDX5397728.1 T9SS type A sorting domain-containing protein [Hymenobacteraceae bacterium]MDX5444376.1 T9SS type A sorting domain-containing protein [Hymenobacteraceae bacterium]MDX5513806.1 T9SS type A sorting domain-containing protein [Hymenobacteraceae bacterium]